MNLINRGKYIYINSPPSPENYLPEFYKYTFLFLFYPIVSYSFVDFQVYYTSQIHFASDLLHGIFTMRLQPPPSEAPAPIRGTVDGGRVQQLVTTCSFFCLAMYIYKRILCWCTCVNAIHRINI